MVGAHCHAPRSSRDAAHIPCASCQCLPVSHAPCGATDDSKLPCGGDGRRHASKRADTSVQCDGWQHAGIQRRIARAGGVVHLLAYEWYILAYHMLSLLACRFVNGRNGNISTRIPCGSGAGKAKCRSPRNTRPRACSSSTIPNTKPPPNPRQPGAPYAMRASHQAIRRTTCNGRRTGSRRSP